MGQEAIFEKQRKADWGDVSFMLLGHRDGLYDEVMDALRYRIGREEYVRELERRLVLSETGANENPAIPQGGSDR